MPDRDPPPVGVTATGGIPYPTCPSVVQISPCTAPLPVRLLGRVVSLPSLLVIYLELNTNPRHGISRKRENADVLYLLTYLPTKVVLTYFLTYLLQ